MDFLLISLAFSGGLLLAILAIIGVIVTVAWVCEWIVGEKDWKP
jgi:hypothetical protein